MNTTALTDSQREQLRSALELRTEQLLQELTAPQPAAPAAYDMVSLQLD